MRWNVKMKQLGKLALAIVALSLSVNGMAANTSATTSHTDERSVYSDAATNERLAPVGHVCIKGQECVAASSDTVASGDSGSDSDSSGSGLSPTEVFDAHCTMCHKTGVSGAPIFGDSDSWAPHIAKGEDTLYHSALNGFNAMPPRGMCTECSDEELKATVRYMVNHSGGDFKAPAKSETSAAAKPKPAADASAKTAAASKPEPTPETDDGMSPSEVFDAHCTMCHKTGVAGAPVFGDSDSWAPHIAKGKDTLYHSALHGLNAMPPRGMCTECSDAELEATVDYMVNHSGGNF